MPVGRGRGGGGHRPAALADQHHRLLGGDDAGAGGGGDLADAVPGDRADRAEGVGRVREQLERGEQAGGDQQRLGDGGVADRLGVGLGAVVDQVEAGDGGQPAAAGRAKVGISSQGVRKPGVWAPWPGATMTSTRPLCRAGRSATRVPTPHEDSRAGLCRNPTKPFTGRGVVESGAASRPSVSATR